MQYYLWFPRSILPGLATVPIHPISQPVQDSCSGDTWFRGLITCTDKNKIRVALYQVTPGHISVTVTQVTFVFLTVL